MPNIKKYQRIADGLAARLARGDYLCGAKLPPERRLARDFDVTVCTVRRALDSLEASGLISREQGRGTYVLRQAPGKAETPRCLALVLADHPRHPYYDETLRVLERLTTKRQWHLVFAILHMEEACLGKLPLALHRGAAAGVFLDGVVQDHHVALLKAHAVPTVVVGSHLLRQSCVRVRADVEQAGYLFTCRLLESTPGPVVFITEPFRLEQSHEVLAGYRRACREHRRREWILPVTDDPEQEEENTAVLKWSLKPIPAPYGVLLNAGVGAVLQRVLKGERQWKGRVHVLCYGRPGPLYGDDHCPIITHRLEQVPLLDTAMEVMEQLLAGNMTDGTVWLVPEWQPGYSGAPLDGRLIWRRSPALSVVPPA